MHPGGGEADSQSRVGNRSFHLLQKVLAAHLLTATGARVLTPCTAGCASLGCCQATLVGRAHLAQSLLCMDTCRTLTGECLCFSMGMGSEARVVMGRVPLVTMYTCHFFPSPGMCLESLKD